MKKTAIVYYSAHHGNTKKLLENIDKEFSVDLFDVKTAEAEGLRSYEVIGLASGIYAGGMQRRILKFIKTGITAQQEAFIVYTAGIQSVRFGKKPAAMLKKKGIRILGQFNCKGWDTFGPFKLIGGISKGHPDTVDIRQFNAFLKTVLTD